MVLVYMFLRFIFPCSKSSTPTEGRMARSGEAAERPCVRILEASTDFAFFAFLLVNTLDPFIYSMCFCFPLCELN